MPVYVVRVSQLYELDIPRLTRKGSIFSRPLKFYCASYTRERNPLSVSSLHENAMRPPLHPLNEHRSPAANPSRRAHPSRQRHPAIGLRCP